MKNGNASIIVIKVFILIYFKNNTFNGWCDEINLT